MNLILIEGIAGSGKSSTAHQLGLHLMKLGYDVAWWFEQDLAHPIYPADQRLQYDQEIDLKARRDIRDSVLARWGELAKTLAGTRKVILMECGFLQMVIDHHLLLDLPMSDATEHVLAVERLISPLDPLLVWLDEDDVEAGMRRIVTDRSSEWVRYLVRLYQHSPYGRKHDIRDYSGVIQAYKASRSAAGSIVDSLRIRKLVIAKSSGDWQGYYDLITRELGVQPFGPALTLPDNAEKLVGSYRSDDEARQDYRVLVGRDALYVSRAARLRLLPKEGNTFHVLGTRWEIEFVIDHTGLAQTAILTEEVGHAESSSSRKPCERIAIQKWIRIK